jgi:hypothetical protein
VSTPTANAEFVRDAPFGRLGLFVLACVGVFGVTALLVVEPAQLVDRGSPVLGHVGRTLGALALLLTLLPCVSVAALRRVYGRCRLRDHTLSFDMLWAGASVEWDLAAIRDFRLTRHGILCRVWNRHWLASLASPLLIPTQDDEQVAAALRALNGSGGEAPTPEPQRLSGWSFLTAGCWIVLACVTFVVLPDFETQFAKTGNRPGASAMFLLSARSWAPLGALLLLCSALWGSTYPRRYALGVFLTTLGYLAWAVLEVSVSAISIM